jgi:hypothetical protein
MSTNEQRSAVTSKDLADYQKTYVSLVEELKANLPYEDAMRSAVGSHNRSEYERFGRLESGVLIMNGLQPDGYVIDVGCGSGRLAKPLSSYLSGKYLGIDIVPNWSSTLAALLAVPIGASRSQMV